MTPLTELLPVELLLDVVEADVAWDVHVLSGHCGGRGCDEAHELWAKRRVALAVVAGLILADDEGEP